MSLSYSNYLHLDSILNSQELKSEGEHDELLFIIIHQTYELWFKQLLHEGRLLGRLFEDQLEFQALATLQRMLVILKTLVKQTDILETMTPLSFASFRNKLEQSSGFQSKQFRMLEFLMGFKNPQKLKMFAPDTQDYRDLLEYLHMPSFYDRFLQYVDTLPAYKLPQEILVRDFSIARTESDSRIEAVILHIYKKDPKLSLICEKLVDLDEGIQEWRYRHVKMVERTIGAKMGTGGSAGVDYLRSSLFRPAFPELWRVRSEF